MDNSTPQQDDLLVRYIDGELSIHEMEDLENKLAVNESLRAELDDLKITREAIRQYGLRNAVANVHREMVPASVIHMNRRAQVKRMIRYGMSIAASVMLIAAGIWAYSFFSLSAEKLYSDNFQSYELTTNRSGANQENAVEKAYRDRKFGEVITLHKKGGHPDNDDFLAGMAALEQNNVTVAIREFQSVLSRDSVSHVPFADEATYYLALSYIKNRDFDLAIPLMEKIHNDPSHPYHNKVSARFIRRVKMLKWR